MISARVVRVRAAIASMLAPLKPREANSAIAASRINARFASGALGLRMFVERAGASCSAIGEQSNLAVSQGNLTDLPNPGKTPIGPCQRVRRFST